MRNIVWTTVNRSGLALVLVVLSASAAKAQETFQLPVSGGSVGHPFNDRYSAKPLGYQTGIEFWGPNMQATSVVASNLGIVDSIVVNGVEDQNMGNCVVIRHAVMSSDGKIYPCYTLYAHLGSIADLQVGQFVKQGQVIGTMGSTGRGQQHFWGIRPHLHFEVRTANGISNPFGGGPYWGYTPTPAENYGYIDPAQVIGRWVGQIPLNR